MRKEGGSILIGVAIGLAMTVGGVLLCTLLMVAYVGAFLLVGIGLVQAAWVIPAYRYFRARGEPETGKGILIVAGLVAMLNTTCWGLLIGTSIKM
jgi:hypothetical protein